MEIEQLRKELNHLLDNVVGHSEGFSDGRQIPPLEISAVLGKINKMQEKLIVLRHLTEIKEKNKRKAVKPVVTERIVTEPIVEKTEPIVLEKDALIEEDIQPVAINFVVPKESKIKDAPAVESVSKVLEGPVEEKQTSSFAEKIQHAPINKLVDAFTLNDRYLYANELFNKDMSAFNELIKSLDMCTNFDEAQLLFNKSGISNNWDVENKLVLDFMGLIERRF